MFAVIPVVLEIIFVILKPHELYPLLGLFKPVFLLPAIIIASGFMKSGRTVSTPYFQFMIGLFIWSLVCTIVANSSQFVDQAIPWGTSILLAGSISQNLQKPKLFRAIAAAMVGMTLFLSYAAIDQAMSPKKCFFSTPHEAWKNWPMGNYCTTPEQCIPENQQDDDNTYKCEHAGIMETTSTDGRIRFRGYLEDPNEISLATAMGLPLAFAFFERRKKFFSGAVMAITLIVVPWAVFLSQSRGSLIALFAGFGIKFVRRFGWKIGGIAGGIAAIPLVVVMGMSGRAEADAEESARERIELLHGGINMVKSSPVIGVGTGGFTNHEFLTAHNSYVLAAAEMGLVGFLTWSIVIYLSLKTPLAVYSKLKNNDSDEAREVRIWSDAIFCSLVSGLIGSFFLSWSYHNYLWIFIGMAGAFFGMAKAEFPKLDVKISGKEVGILFAINITLLVVINFYTLYKMNH